MSNIVAVLIVRCTHTGVYADGRPNTASVTIYDLDEITIQKNRTRYVPIPAGAGTTLPPVDIPMSTRTFVSWHDGDICKFTKLGLINSEIILQLRDKGNCGGPAGTGQALRPAVLNTERAADSLRLVIPDNVIPTTLDSVGFMVGEPVTITGFADPGVPAAYRGFDGDYVISVATPGDGLAGAAPGSYLIEVPLPTVAVPLPAVTLTGINLCLTEGRVTSQFNATGDTGGFGDNVFGYVGGQFLPHAAGGGGGSVAVFDEGVLVDAAVTSFDFIGNGVTASSAGAGAVDITIPGGGGAPVNAEYLVLSTDLTLTDERVFTAGTGIAVVDGGAGGLFTVSVDATWAEILSNGNLSGGTNPTISTGDSIIGVTDLVLDPGAGVGDNVIIDGLTWPSADGTVGQAIITDSFGVLSFGNPTAGLAVQDEGVTFETAPTTLNFIGPGVTAATGGAGIVNVTIPGGGGTVTLQQAYENGNTIVTSATEGPLDVSGTESISLDSSSFSNFTVTGADLLLSTVTSGDVFVTSADAMTLTSGALMTLFAGANLDVDVVGNATVDATGTFSIDGVGSSNVTTTSGTLDINTLTAGPINVVAADGVLVRAGDEAAAAGNDVLVEAGDGGGANDGGEAAVSGGDSGAGATGDGGDVLVRGGDALSTNGSGGDLLLTTGAGTGTGTAGTVNLTGPNDEDEAIATLTTTGVSGDSVEFFVGDNDPSGSVTGLAGSLFFRDTGAGGELYLNTSVGSGTTWSQIQTTATTGSTAILQWGNNSVGSSTATRVLDPGYENRTAPLAAGTAFIDLRVPRAGTLRNLYIYHNNPGGTGAVITYTIFVNGIATAISAGLASTGTVAADTVNSVVVAAGDRVRVQVTKVASAGGGSRRPEVSLEVAA
jgi:hypothetical protein